MFDVLFSKKAAVLAGSLPKGNKKKLRKIIDEMKINPFSYPYKKIRGKKGLYRVRIGQFRFLYQVDESHQKVFIIKMETRQKVFKKN
ncbi:MAG: type II toxin-antitoxin system RelE/ParE family toxin [Candidatus Undinarchaeales archaeon]|jgi:mRNA interferase RelE/StbE|nr:type II toxin-antitoxin system RelE/ParE family toxin [Candidatus Undinarchaeales archaeon]